MGYTEQATGFSNFVVDENSLVRTQGRQIDWSGVTAGADGVKRLPAGKAMYETGTGQLAVRDGANPAVGILETPADDASRSHAINGYGFLKGGSVYAELLPDAGDAAFATIQTELGPRFTFETYADSRAA